MRVFCKYSIFLALLLFAAGLKSFGQIVEWESAISTTKDVGASREGGRVVLTDTSMVFSGATRQFGRAASPGNIYGRTCLLWVRPDNARPPRMMLLPVYNADVALCKMNGDLHGIAVDFLPIDSLGNRRMLYFRCSPAGELLDTLFLPPPPGVAYFTAAAPMGEGKILATSRIYDPASGFIPWVGLFDIRTVSWVWQKQIPSLRFRLGSGSAWKADAIYGKRALVTGDWGSHIYYSIVDSTGPSAAIDLWHNPDTTRGFSSAKAWPRPDGGWAVSGSGGGLHFAILDENLNQTYYNGETGIYTVLSDNGFLAAVGPGSTFVHCRLNSQGASDWCTALFVQPQHAIAGALPADSGDAVVFGWQKDQGNAMSFYFARIGGVGEFYNPGTDSTRFPITGVKSRIKSHITLQVYPNPSSSTIHVQGLAGKEAILLSMDGRILKETRLDGNGKAVIDLSDFPKSIYLVRSEEAVVRVARE